jgi:hemerythrin-like domain-containing protein
MSTKATSEGSLLSIGQWRIHRAIENAIDATVKSIVTVQNTKDAMQIKHLLEHIETVIFFLHGHHEHEEQIVFPELRKKIAERAAVFDTLVGEHQQVRAAIIFAPLSLQNVQNTISHHVNVPKYDSALLVPPASFPGYLTSGSVIMLNHINVVDC